jgi:hypothetical protein
MQFIYKIHDEETIVKFRKANDDIISNKNINKKKEVKSIEKLQIYNFNIPTNIEYGE